MQYPLQLLASGTPDTTEQLPVGFRASYPYSRGKSSADLVRFSGGQAADATFGDPNPVLAERKVKVDPDVAYESGLCTNCEPTKPQPWESGPLFWMMVAFGFFIIIIVSLFIAATALCIKYTQQFAFLGCKPPKRRC